MTLNFTLLEKYVIIVIYFWYITVPVGLILGGITIYAKDTGWGLRSLPLIGSIIFLVPFVLFGIFLVKGKLDQRQRQQKREAHTWTLEKPQTVAGVELAAGSKIFLDTWYDMDKKKQAELRDIERFYFSEPTKIFGVVVEGYFYESGYTWEGTLSGNQTINGWPTKGKIEITEEGKLIKGTLSKAHTIFGRTIPAGSRFELDSSDRWSFTFPEGKSIRFDPEIGKIIFSSDSSDAFNFSDKKYPEIFSWKLRKGTEIAGVKLPLGTVIYFYSRFDMDDKEQADITDIYRLDLPEPTEIFNIVVKGTFERPVNDRWAGTLQGTQMINGWPCAGHVVIERNPYNNKDDLKLKECTLFEGYTVGERTFPAGTNVELQRREWTFHLPEGKIIKFDPDIDP